VYQRDYPATGAGPEMLAEYARYPLFGTVGIDSSFYTPLTEKTLQSYGAALPEGFPCLSKVWDRLTVHTFAKSRDKARAGQLNPDFLNPDVFLESVWGPLKDHFAGHTGPLIFEFQAIARQDKVGPLDFAERLDRFFARLPREGRYAVEARNPEFLTPAYFAVLRCGPRPEFLDQDAIHRHAARSPRRGHRGVPGGPGAAPPGALLRRRGGGLAAVRPDPGS
jgi:uncharacterized protein YecE (DUF72 family)